MDTSPLVSLFAYLFMIAAISERAIEQAKILVSKEKLKKHPKLAIVVFHGVGIATGAACSFLIPFKTILVLRDITDPWAAALVIGFLSAAGSGPWHDLMGAVSKAKQSIRSSSTE